MRGLLILTVAIVVICSSCGSSRDAMMNATPEYNENLKGK